MASVKKLYVQYSKRITTAITIFWCAMRLFAVIAVYLNPSCGADMATIVRGIDDIEMVVVLSYTGNSVSEKVAVGYFESKAEKKKETTEEIIEETTDYYK